MKDKEHLKEMYDMGTRLIEMAEALGYSDDGESEGYESEEMESEMEDTKAPVSGSKFGKDKKSIALSLL